MEKVVSLVTQKTEFDWPEEVTELVLKIKQYNEMLEDYRQGKVLKKLGRGKIALYKGSYMSAHVLLNLLNELRKRDKM